MKLNTYHSILSRHGGILAKGDLHTVLAGSSSFAFGQPHATSLRAEGGALPPKALLHAEDGVPRSKDIRGERQGLWRGRAGLADDLKMQRVMARASRAENKRLSQDADSLRRSVRGE